MLDKISLVLVIIGAINWALIGIFQFDLVAYLFGGQAAVVSRIVYTLVGAAGLWCISLRSGSTVAPKKRSMPRMLPWVNTLSTATRRQRSTAVGVVPKARAHER